MSKVASLPLGVTANRSPASFVPSPEGADRAAASLSARGDGERNASRFSDARLHAVSSRNMYSEHGFDARIGPDAGQVCQSLMVEWNCRPGSADAHAA